MAVLPEEVPTGLVTGQYYFVNEDNVDVDTNPDLTVVSGLVRFIPTETVIRMPSKLVTLILMPFKAKFDSTGQLVEENSPEVGVRLVATDSALLNAGKPFQWKVQFDLVEVATGFTVDIPDMTISVPTGATIDLSTLI